MGFMKECSLATTGNDQTFNKDHHMVVAEFCCKILHSTRRFWMSLREAEYRMNMRNLSGKNDGGVHHLPVKTEITIEKVFSRSFIRNYLPPLSLLI